MSPAQDIEEYIAKKQLVVGHRMPQLFIPTDRADSRIELDAALIFTKVGEVNKNVFTRRVYETDERGPRFPLVVEVKTTPNYDVVRKAMQQCVIDLRLSPLKKLTQSDLGFYMVTSVKDSPSADRQFVQNFMARGGVYAILPDTRETFLNAAQKFVRG